MVSHQFQIDENPGHYKKLAEVLGNEPTDEWVPSFKVGHPKFNKEEQGCPSTTLCGQNIRKTAQRSSRKRFRGVYANRKLLNKESPELNRILSEYDYVCGSHIIPDDSFLKGEVFTRVVLTCRSSMEWQYYSYTSGRKDRCSYCGGDGGIIVVVMDGLLWS